MSNKNEIKDIAKKIVFTGIGAVAVAAEAAGGVVEKLAEKGEQVAADSKLINDGKKAVKDFKENVAKSPVKKAMDAVADMTKEEREALRKKLDEVEAEIKEMAENMSEALNEDVKADSESGENMSDDEVEVEIFYDVKPEDENSGTESTPENGEENKQ